MRPQNQTLLTLILAVCMLTGFMGVAAVGYYYDNNGKDSELVWKSDSNTEFQSLDVTNSLPYFTSKPGFPNPYGLSSVSEGTTNYTYNNATGIYLGNNTWGSSMVGFAATTPNYITAYHHIPMMIREARTFIADTIEVTLSLPGDITGQKLTCLVGSNHNPEKADFSGLSYFMIFNNLNVNGQTWHNFTYDLTTYEKLLWYTNSQNVEDSGIWFYIQDSDPSDGFSSFALKVSVAVYGQYSTTWTLQNSINTVLGGTIILNIAVMIFMSDRIDIGHEFGKGRKDLPAKKRR